MSERVAAHPPTERAGTRMHAVAVACVALACSLPASAQLAPRLTAQVAIDELTAAQASLGTPGATAGALSKSVGTQLAGMSNVLQASMGNEATKPVEMVGDALRANIVRAHAAAARVAAYKAAVLKCQASDAAAMQAALADGIALLASGTGAAKQIPVIDTVETMEHQPLFALRKGRGPMAFALIGSNLADAQCADPLVSATDLGGRVLPAQPTLTGSSPSRLELRWSDRESLPTGSLVLHVSSQRKAFLVGCTALPPASAVIRVVPVASVEVSYSLEAVCAGKSEAGGVVSLGHGKMPPLAGQGATVSVAVDTSACVNPQTYRLSATVIRGDGNPVTVGPFSQSAQASLTAGLPGGLSMSWKPAVQTLFVSSGMAACPAVH